MIGGGVDVEEAAWVEGGCGSCGACDVMHLTENLVVFLLGNWVVVVRGVTVVVAMKSEEAAIVLCVMNVTIESYKLIMVVVVMVVRLVKVKVLIG